MKLLFVKKLAVSLILFLLRMFAFWQIKHTHSNFLYVLFHHVVNTTCRGFIFNLGKQFSKRRENVL